VTRKPISVPQVLLPTVAGVPKELEKPTLDYLRCNNNLNRFRQAATIDLSDQGSFVQGLLSNIDDGNHHVNIRNIFTITQNPTEERDVGPESCTQKSGLNVNLKNTCIEF